MRNARFPKPEEDLMNKQDELLEPKKFYEQKFENKATPVNTNHPDQKVLINHKVMSLAVKRDLIQSCLQ